MKNELLCISHRNSFYNYSLKTFIIYPINDLSVNRGKFFFIIYRRNTPIIPPSTFKIISFMSNQILPVLNVAIINNCINSIHGHDTIIIEEIIFNLFFPIIKHIANANGTVTTML